MAKWKKFLGPALWISALAAALAFMGVDTAVHTRTTRELTSSLKRIQPVLDPASPSGYAGNQHEVILPYTGLDGFHWVMQTQQMLASGELRVRGVDYDNAPDGREVHWASPLRWWLALVAWFDHVFTGTPLPQAVESVVPFANTILIGIILVALTPVVARRFGAGAAALLAFGMVAIGPFYESYAAGRGDHHGLAAMCALLTLLFLIAGGGGWVLAPASSAGVSAPATTEDGDANAATDAALRAWVPERRQARRWFIASGIVGGIGLWVSAASEVPVLCGIGLGALLAGVLGRQVRGNSVALPEPSLWRVWGVAGAAASLSFYLLEYFPAHFGARLEVNHPLYALAWAGAGEILFRACTWIGGGKIASLPRDRALLAASLGALVLLPFLVFLFPEKTFWVRDPFLYAFHRDYIIEFWPLWTFLASQPMALFLVMANPLVLLGVVMLAWAWRRSVSGFGWAIGLAVVAVGLFLWLGAGVSASHARWIFLLAAVGGMLVFLCVWSRWPKFPRPARALLLVALPPCAVSFAMALWQVRWVEISSALWLAGLVTAVQALRLQPNFRWTFTRTVGAGALLVWALVPGPALMAHSWVTNGFRSLASREELLELVGRDVAQSLRARAGGKSSVVLSDPTTTTWLIYFGGLRGLGTFYWENLAGLKASEEIYAAKSEEEAFAAIQKHSVRYLVFVSWSDAAAEFARLARGLPRSAPPPADAFVLHMLKTPAFPPWVRPVFYEMPPLEPYKNDKILILEVVPDQAREEALVRFAEWQLQSGNREGALANANAALMAHRDYLPALLLGARLQYSANARPAFAATVQRVREYKADWDKLGLEDRVDLAVVLSLGGDTVNGREQLQACIAAAKEDDWRRLRPEALFNLLSLSRLAGLRENRAGWWDEAAAFLPPDRQAQLYYEYALAERNAGRHASAAALMRRALEGKPDSTAILAALSLLLSISPDDSVRNGAEAVALAERAAKADQSQSYVVADILACAYAEMGDFDRAVAEEQRALAGAQKANVSELVRQFDDRLALFRSKRPYHSPAN